jgi:hypothetical protein
LHRGFLGETDALQAYGERQPKTTGLSITKNTVIIGLAVEFGSRWVLVCPLVFKTSRWALVASGVGSIPTYSRQCYASHIPNECPRLIALEGQDKFASVHAEVFLFSARWTRVLMTGKQKDKLTNNALCKYYSIERRSGHGQKNGKGQKKAAK